MTTAQEHRALMLDLLKAGHPAPRPIEWLLRQSARAAADINETQARAALAYLVDKGLVRTERTAVNDERWVITAVGIDAQERGDV